MVEGLMSKEKMEALFRRNWEPKDPDADQTPYTPEDIAGDYASQLDATIPTTLADGDVFLTDPASEIVVEAQRRGIPPIDIVRKLFTTQADHCPDATFLVEPEIASNALGIPMPSNTVFTTQLPTPLELERLMTTPGMIEPDLPVSTSADITNIATPQPITSQTPHFQPRGFQRPPLPDIL